MTRWNPGGEVDRAVGFRVMDGIFCLKSLLLLQPLLSVWLVIGEVIAVASLLGRRGVLASVV